MAGMTLEVLGCRGSVPVSGPEFSQFGGATSCYLVRAGGQAVFLDAGSGMVRGEVAAADAVSILLSHPHADHLIGLPFLPALSQPDREVALYAEAHGGLLPREQVERLFSPPLWPVSPFDLPADFTAHHTVFPRMLGSLSVQAAQGCHPGGATAFRIEHEGASLVYATDFEGEDEAFARVAQLAAEADLLLVDAQYTSEEYPYRRGFGHSTPAMGIELAQAAGVRRVLFIHHDPRRADEALLAMEREAAEAASERGIEARFAREGQVIDV